MEKMSAKGVAYIKPEYLLPVVKKDMICVQTESNNDDVPKKKRKRTGMNKNRPKVKKTPAYKRLCRNLWHLAPGEGSDRARCHYEKCPYSHDAEAFLREKDEDISPVCYMYETYGRCPYGLACRFGSSHIEEGGSRINHEKWESVRDFMPVSNFLKKEVNFALRKRDYDYSRALKAIQKITECEQHNGNSQKPLDTISDPGKVNRENNMGDTGNATENSGGYACESKSDLSDPHKEIACAPVESGSAAHREIKKVDWENKLYLAPLTTVGNLPFRRVCKKFGADITCSEMAVATCLLQGSMSEWALVKRHHSENIFGVQLCGSNSDVMIKCAQLLDDKIQMDFVDINMGCPIDLIYRQGAGSALLRRQAALERMVKGMMQVLYCPVTLKMRTSIDKNSKVAHKVIEKAKLWDVNLITVHGRSREHRYIQTADWEYINNCAKAADPVPLFGSGDVLTYEEYNYHRKHSTVKGIMIGRGALIKPWIFTEIKEQRHWDISSAERFEILKDFTNYGLEHWGSDSEGVEKTRWFLLEWLSFLHRYIPYGLLEQTQLMNARPPPYFGRDDLETLMASFNARDWIRISEMLLGPVPANFPFLPKYKANAWG